MPKTIRARALLTFVMGMALTVFLPAHAADNDGLATDFGGFGAGGIVADAPLLINDMATLPDGKIIAVGTQNNTVAVARFMPNGALDTGFGADGVVAMTVTEGQQQASAHSVVLQPDNKIVVAGEVTGAADTDFAVLRLLPNGALDTSFGANGRVVIDFARGNDRARALAITSTKHFIVGGWAAIGGNDDFAVVGLTPSGAIDANFGAGGRVSMDFGNQEHVKDLVVQSDDQVVLFGDMSDADDDTSRLALVRLTPNGTPDATFDGDGRLFPDIKGSANARSIALQEEGKIIVAGDWVDQGFLIARFLPSGAPDPTFDGDGVIVERFGGQSPGARAVLLTKGGQILVAGRGDDRMALVRYDNGGQRDPYFGTSGQLFVDGVPAAASMALLRTFDGRTLVGGGRQLAQLFNDGALDSGGRQLAEPRVASPLIGGRLASADSYGVASLAQPDGKIVSVGNGFYGRNPLDLVVARHTPAGLPDASFGTGGAKTFGIPGSNDYPSDALIGRGEKVVVVGSTWASGQPNIDLFIGRLDANGAPDENCGPGGIAVHNFAQTDQAQSVTMQADGKIVVAGTISDKMLYQAFVARFNDSCAFDPAFGIKGVSLLGYGADIADVRALPNDKLLVVGTEKNTVFLTRLDASGALDTSFGTDGKTTTTLGMSLRVIAAVGLPGDKTLVVLRLVDKEVYTLLARYTASGKLDQTFGKDGLVAVDLGSNGVAAALAVRDDGAIAVAGCSDEQASQPVVLLGADGRPAQGFSGDGKTDLRVGGTTCLNSAVFSGERLIVGGYAENDRQSALLLAAYATGDGACCEPRTVGFAADAATVAENAGGTTLTVRLSQTSAQTVTVQYTTTGGTATNGADYTLAAGTLTFVPGETSQRMSVALTNDQAAEGDETIVVTLANSSNAELGATASFTLTIADDEAPAPPTPVPPTPVPPTPVPPTPGRGNPIFLPLVRR